jgi:bifunctional non-homologous end joining protein LigD
MARNTNGSGISRTALRPMLATLIDGPFDDPDWVFEIKWDGYRVLSRIEDGKVTLYSRHGKDVTSDYPQIAAALSKMRHDAVLDGELVALDDKGRSNFQLLQNIRHTKARLRYYVFDLLFLDGKNLRGLPLIERKRLLRSILPKSTLVCFSRHVRKYGTKLFRLAQRRGLEGIVAKRAQGLYYSGKRTREWLKIKTARRQEVVIVGFTRPRGSRKYFGALVLAVRDGDAWRYVGHTGTGFSEKSLKTIYEKLRPLVRPTKPFREKVPRENETTWVSPKLVAEVKFTEWTKSGQMRHPAFVGLRTDKPARDVVREREIRMSKPERRGMER